MSDSSYIPRALSANAPGGIAADEVVFDCPACGQGVVVNRAAVRLSVNCPLCGQLVVVPERRRVTTLGEAPETHDIQSRPVWEQELLTIESALKESLQQRQEAGNFYKHHVSEANRLQLRIAQKDPGLPPDAALACKKHLAEAGRQKQRAEKLNARLKELDARKAAILAQHPRS
ncbi:MAG: hypothetical protein HY360_12175 [Verrucomicrobia bacterium]|nr:hypothetical protein [Verrucomicrobiota bacterium]